MSCGDLILWALGMNLWALLGAIFLGWVLAVAFTPPMLLWRILLGLGITWFASEYVFGPAGMLVTFWDAPDAAAICGTGIDATLVYLVLAPMIALPISALFWRRGRIHRMTNEARQ